MRLKVTKTLIESWAYMFSAFEGYEEDAYNDFLKTLKREPVEDNEAMRDGRDFENLCYRMARGEQVTSPILLPSINPVTGEAHEGGVRCPKWYEGARKVVPYIKGGQFQVPVSYYLTLDGRDFYLFGICDVVRAGVIYDIKFRTKSLGSDDVYGKYLNYSQHSLYLKALPEAQRFVYLVSDGTDLYTEVYSRDGSKPIEEHIRYFWDWLRSKPDLMEIYLERWAL